MHLDNQHWLYLIGRMKPGVQVAPVEAELTSGLRQWQPTVAADFSPSTRAKIPKQTIKLGPGGEGITELKQRYQSGLYMLIAASALVGGYYQLPLTTKLSLTANIELGVAEAWSPKQTVTGVRDSVGFGPVDAVQTNLHSASATAFTALAGLGVRYQLRSRWALLARVDYTWLKPTFNLTATLTNAQHFAISGISSLSNATVVDESISKKNYTQPMPCIDVMFGVIREL